MKTQNKNDQNKIRTGQTKQKGTKACVYMLRCRDGSLYTGITTDLARRFREHLKGGKEAAGYTKSHPPLYMAAAFAVESLQIAARFEYAIKQLKKSKKEALVSDPCLIHSLLPLARTCEIHPLDSRDLPAAAPCTTSSDCVLRQKSVK